ncbi:Profilin/allergen [Penicillium roqueforti FM164]|uniref:Profilin/allergen n=1 Tax=Penicillium roqueforti (strain FM164) TaxID=1365484 RepID=W6Q7U3_PENRF|nr:Profilin/allergen [Penicillium roqueforti FM164]
MAAWQPIRDGKQAKNQGVRVRYELRLSQPHITACT